ncbi:hypothetical protein BaRGS_00007867, partial [Batillaria attramentaria]
SKPARNRSDNRAPVTQTKFLRPLEKSRVSLASAPFLFPGHGLADFQAAVLASSKPHRGRT